MNNELVITLGYILAVLVMLAVGLGIAYLVSQPGKRELREELEELKRVRVENEDRLYEYLEKQKERYAELEKAVAFYKAECGYYKAQAEKNLELLRRAAEHSEVNPPPANAGAPFTQRGQTKGGK